MVDVIVFIISASVILGGAIGVIFNPNPVHAALSLIATFFGVAILFVLQEVHFLASGASRGLWGSSRCALPLCNHVARSGRDRTV